MGTTLDSLKADAGIQFSTVILIEGYGYALTDGSANDVFTALDASSAPYNAYVEVLGGASVRWNQRQQVDPWKPLGDDPPALSFVVVPGARYNTDPGTIHDDFGRDVWKRTGGNETTLTAAGTITPASTTVLCQSTQAFAAGPSTAYIGPEAIGYTTNDLGANSFTTLTRAKWTPLTTSSGTRFARGHKSIDLSSATGEPIGVKAPPLVSSEPRKWIGRWVSVHMLAHRGGSTLDILDQGHRAFVGMIANVRQGEAGETIVECEHVLRRIYETQIGRDQFRATIQEGVPLHAGMSFQCRTARTVGAVTTIGDATVLSVVASGATAPGQINAGIYTAVEIGEAVTRWLQEEKAGTRIIFNVAYDGAYNSGQAGGIRGNLSYNDPTSTADLRRTVLILPSAHVAEFLGWDGNDRVVVEDTSRTGYTNSPYAPFRINLRPNTNGDPFAVRLDGPSGTWVNQLSVLPPLLRDAAGLATGILKLGDLGYFAASRTSDVLFTLYPSVDVGAYFPRVIPHVVDYTEDVALDVQQVIVAQGTFRELMLKVLLSTGSAAYNSEWDVLGEGLGCAIPYSILTDAFVVDLDNTAESGRTICMIVDKPTRFVDLFNADFQTLWSHLVWRDGRLSLRTWTTPTTGALGAVSVGDADKAVPAEQATGDKQRRSCDESFESLRNVVLVKFARSSGGELVSNIVLSDQDSLGSHGTRGETVEMRNTAGRSAIGDVIGRLSAMSAALPLFSKPSQIITGTMSRQMYEQLPPLTPVLLTAREIRNPETGLAYSHVTGTGGLNGWPGIVVGNTHDWGGVSAGIDGQPTLRPPTGSVEIMIYDRVNGSTYSPCAELDDTADAGGFTSGYNSGTNTIRCYTNKHSVTGSDAAEFAALDEIQVIEIDPPVAASALSWFVTVVSRSGNDLVIDATLTAFDATKYYRVRAASYTASVATQQTDVYQASSSDGLIVDARQPYGMIYSGTGQSATFTASASTEIPARHSTIAYGDGTPLDTGYERDIARLANNLIDYKNAIQCPQVGSEEYVFSGSGTWELILCEPIFIRVGLLGTNETIKLYVAPFWKSTDGTSTQVRYRLHRLWPSDDTRNDTTFAAPYVETTFTTTTTTYSVPTAVALDTRHLNRAPGSLGGVGWLTVEIKNKASVRGVAGHLRVGPRGAP